MSNRQLAIMLPTKSGTFSRVTTHGLIELSTICCGAKINFMPLYLESHCYIDNARNALVRLALDAGATDLLFIDDDIEFKGSDIAKLLIAAPERKVVCGIYRTKSELPVAACKLVDPIETPMVDKYYRRLAGAPTGMFLVRREVYEDPAIIEQSPMYTAQSFQGGEVNLHCYYETARIPVEGAKYPVFHGEDIMFSKKLLKAGYTIWGDMRLNLGHIGNYNYKFEMEELE